MRARSLTIISTVLAATVLSIYLAAASMANRDADGTLEGGVRRLRSAYRFAETVARLKAEVAAKGIMLFSEIDQAGLAAGAGISLHPSTLLVFGNPPLGVQFITSKAQAGLDWPVRLLVYEDANGQVWSAYSEFSWIAQRHGIEDREQAFKMAASVIASITASVAAH